MVTRKVLSQASFLSGNRIENSRKGNEPIRQKQKQIVKNETSETVFVSKLWCATSGNVLATCPKKKDARKIVQFIACSLLN